MNSVISGKCNAYRPIQRCDGGTDGGLVERAPDINGR